MFKMRNQRNHLFPHHITVSVSIYEHSFHEVFLDRLSDHTLAMSYLYPVAYLSSKTLLLHFMHKYKTDSQMSMHCYVHCNVVLGLTLAYMITDYTFISETLHD